MKCKYSTFILGMMCLSSIQPVFSQEDYPLDGKEIDRYFEVVGGDRVGVVLDNGDVCYFFKSNSKLYERFMDFSTRHEIVAAKCVQESMNVEIGRFVANKRLDRWIFKSINKTKERE